MLKVLNDDLGAKIQRADMSVLKNDLPPKKEFVITVPLTDVQRKAYTLYVRSMLEGAAYSRTKTGEVTQTTIWHWLAILSLLCNHPACFKAKLVERKEDAQKALSSISENSGSKDNTDADNAIDINASVWKVGVSEDLIAQEMSLFQEEALDINSIDLSYKVKIMCQILDAAKSAGDKTLIFSESIPTLNYLEDLCKAQGRRYARLDGKTNMTKRQQMTKDFNHGDTDIYLISTGAGGVGLNLHGANRVIIIDFKFNPAKEEQAVGRAYRIGQQKPTYVYRFVAGGTFETSIHNKTVYKMQLASRVIDKKNPIAYAKKSLGEYLFEPKDVPQSDLSEFLGMDPFVLDKILASQEQMPTICGIVQTDTFERVDDDKLTAEEENEVIQLQYEAKLRRVDPKRWEELQRQRQFTSNRSATPVGSGRGALNQADWQPTGSGQFRRRSQTPTPYSSHQQNRQRASPAPRMTPAPIPNPQNTFPVSSASANNPRGGLSPILGASSRSAPDTGGVMYPVGESSRDSAPSFNRDRAYRQAPIPSIQNVVQPTAPKLPATDIQILLQDTAKTMALPDERLKMKLDEISSFAMHSLPTSHERNQLRRSVYLALNDSQQKCFQILSGELTIEDLFRPLLNAFDQPPPSSSSSNGESGQVRAPGSSLLSSDVQPQQSYNVEKEASKFQAPTTSMSSLMPLNLPALPALSPPRTQSLNAPQGSPAMNSHPAVAPSSVSEGRQRTGLKNLLDKIIRRDC